MELQGTLDVKDLLKSFAKEQFLILSDSGLASKPPVLKPWFSAMFRPMPLCNLFLWEMGLCSAFCCAFNWQASNAHTPPFTVYGPCTGDHRSRLCSFLVHGENTSMSSQRFFRLHKPEF